ncbi:MAG: hypothetical protein ACP5GL_08410, partial [Infirmifilum sp.]
MNNTRKIELILLALLPILLVGAIAINTSAQTGGAYIQSVAGTASDGNAYPGEPITVTVSVNLAGRYTVELAADPAGDTVWASQVFNAPTADTYTVILTLPLSLPNLTSPPTVYILLTGPLTYDNKNLTIYPKVVVSPAETFVVDQNGNAKIATVNVYGVDPGENITNFTFTGPITDTYNLSTPIKVENDGTASVNLTLSGTSTGFTSTEGLPRGTYNVTFGGSSNISYINYTKPGTIKILPVLLITPDNGSGKDSDLTGITLTGYSFDPNATIAGVNFTNTNFTNVYYYFDFTTLNFTTDGRGYWNFTNLSQVFSTNMTAGLYTLSVVEELTQTENTTLPFPNTYYLVRPILIVTPTSAVPGQTLTITAYGYGPGEAWGYAGKNTLTVSLDRTIILTTVILGKDGNLTFTVTLPSSNIPFGAHYIWGRDAWGYEYSAAVIITPKGFYEIVNAYTGIDKKTPEAYAGYNNATLIVCPCEQYTGLKFCDQCAVYNGGCDYVGDKIVATLNGLNPGETVNIYFGSLLMATATADSNGAATASFVVPTVPQGSYTITATGASFGTITLYFAYKENNKII